MRIRRFHERDASAVSDLIIAALRRSNIRDYPEDMLEELARHQQPADVEKRASWTHFYVAEEAGSIIGCGAIGPYWGSETESCLFSFFVHPDWQRRGVGKALMAALEADAFALRAKRIEIPASITGLPFYRRMGYDFKPGGDQLDKEMLYRLEKRRPSAEQTDGKENNGMKTIDILGDNRYAAFTKTRAGSRAVILDGENLLLCCEPGNDLWMIPGGGVETGETPEACCVREAEEETGLLVRPEREYLTVNEYYEEYRYVTHYFVCRIAGLGQMRLTEAERARGVRPEWLPFQQALDIFSRHRDFDGVFEEKRGIYLREYTALAEYRKQNEQEPV